MRCFRCNSVLNGNRDICNKCGQDVRLYKKLCRSSNAYYNVGLNKARVRDLTGAVNALKMSVGLDKTNIDARNLLGLVYFEMGEVALAIREWVISTNMLGEDNEAADYLRTLQNNPNKLDVITTNIRKYNIALGYAQSEGEDLAVIQLKKVIAQYPQLIRAYHLLALLYIHQKQYRKAEGLLKKVLKIDKGNTTARRYLYEIRHLTGKAEVEAQKEARQKANLMKSIQADALASAGDSDESEYDRVIVPLYTKSFGSYFITALDVLIGLVLGAGIIFFLVNPGYKNYYAEQYNQKVIAYEASESKNKTTITELKETIASLKEEKSSLEKQLEMAETEEPGEEETPINSKVEKKYESVLALLVAYQNNETEGILENARNLSADEKDSKALQDAYAVIQTIYKDYSDAYYDLGYKVFQKGEELNAKEDPKALDSYNAAIENFEGCIGINPDNAAAYAWLGVCYHHMGQLNKAKDCYVYYLENFPDFDPNIKNMVETQLEPLK